MCWGKGGLQACTDGQEGQGAGCDGHPAARHIVLTRACSPALAEMGTQPLTALPGEGHRDSGMGSHRLEPSAGWSSPQGTFLQKARGR